jgi:hypothetical protein
VLAALLSNRGVFHRLLRLVGDHRWRINSSLNWPWKAGPILYLLSTPEISRVLSASVFE